LRYQSKKKILREVESRKLQRYLSYCHIRSLGVICVREEILAAKKEKGGRENSPEVLIEGRVMEAQFTSPNVREPKGDEEENQDKKSEK